MVMSMSMPLSRPPIPAGNTSAASGMGLNKTSTLIQAKCIIGLLEAGVGQSQIVREVALFGVANRDGWASGLTSLTALSQARRRGLSGSLPIWLFAKVPGGSRPIAMASRPAASRRPLETAAIDLSTLNRWFRYWTLVRHRDGAERTLRTAIRNGASPAQLADMVFTAATDRFYADGGHVLDFANKAFELLDLIGWEHAEHVLPAVVPQLVAARGGEEQNAWRHPHDLVPALRAPKRSCPICCAAESANRGTTWPACR